MSTIDGNGGLFKELGLRPDSTKTEGESSQKLGQEDFLDLLTTQLRNQNPTKPMESGKFFNQMAQFSTVSGINDLQSSFQDLADSLISNQALQASSLVGRRVLAPTGSGILPTSGSLSGAVELDKPADQVRVDIFDSSGQLVRQVDLGQQGSGVTSFEWDGVTNDGTRAPAGTYTLKAEATTDGESRAAETLTAAEVDSVTLDRNSNGVTLNVAGLGSLDLSEIRQIM